MKKHFRIILPIAVLLLFLFLFFMIDLFAFSKAVNSYSFHGIDISHHQGEIDWESVLPAEGVEFVFIKSTEGTSWKDSRFDENWQGAGRLGIPRGAYHFYTLKHSGCEQADFFNQTVPLHKNELPPVVDLEFSGNSQYRPSQDEFTRELIDYLDRVEEVQGTRPVIYTTRHFYRRYLKKHFSREQFWIRDTHIPPKWWRSPRWIFWQYSDSARVTGIEGEVDKNLYRCRKDEDDLFDLLNRP